jgi:4-hydroxybenzoate polyprenyltransferase
VTTASTAAAPTADAPPVTLRRALKSIHRLEVLPNQILVLTWGMFVAASRPSDLWTASAILALGINGLSLFGGFVLNSYSDYPIDKRSPVKFYIARGVERIGRRNVLYIYIAEQVITVAMSVVVSELLHNWAFVLVKLIGIGAGYLYNAEPIRLKRRALWNPVMNSIRMGFIPGLIGYLAVHEGTIGAGGWILLVGMTLVQMSRIGFWVSVMDTEEDTAEHIRTPSVVFGPRPVMVTSITLGWLATIVAGTGLVFLFGPLGVLGAVGGIGAQVYRMSLYRRSPDDQSAIALCRARTTIRRERLWDKTIWAGVIAVGLVHLLVVVA